LCGAFWRLRTVLDMAELHGKVVLLDIWSLGCSSCIAAMPGIRKVYEKYRDQGFEVVGLCLVGNDKDEMTRVRNTLQKAGGDAWQNTFIAGDELDAFSRKYSIRSVPVTWLLDRSGKLVTANLGYGDKSVLEEEVRRLLMGSKN
jgi:thiol-disulfide isomerase/thioredoxin